jgi:hypothetical protein
MTRRRDPRFTARALFAALALSCAVRSRAPVAAAAVDCEVDGDFDPALVVAPLVLRDCPIERVAKHPLFRGWSSIPVDSLPAHTRVSAFDAVFVVFAFGPGPGDVSDHFIRADFTTPDLASAWFTTHAPTTGATHVSMYAPPERWPIHPSVADEDAAPPPWWPALGAAGDAVSVQQPAEFDPCVTYGASGELWFHADRSVWVYTWYRQWFGSCGG